MERLTEKLKNGTYVPKAPLYEMCDRLGAYEDLEEQGKLLKLPCNVGDFIYILLHNHQIRKSKVIRFKMNAKRWEAETEDWFYLFEEFGKTVFLTEGEARTALEGMEAAHEKEKEQPRIE